MTADDTEDAEKPRAGAYLHHLRSMVSFHASHKHLSLYGMTITHISDTARWVAYYRAMESQRPDAIFEDPFAERLAGPEGKAIVHEMKRGRQMAWAMIVRTALFDEQIYDAIRGKQVDLVVNLAAGLDARPWRMELPPTLRWVDVDLPDILDYKLEKLKGETARCVYQAVKVDLTDDARRHAALTQLGASASRVLVVTEGLLIYLTPEQVGALATDLHAASSFKWWIIDLAHPRLLKMMQRMWGKSLSAGNAPFKFAPEDGTKFFEKFGWKELRFVSQMDAAQRLNREMSGAWLWRPMMMLYPKRMKETMKRFSGTVVLERI
jgi:methyltransferase (TIGR00027 family)